RIHDSKIKNCVFNVGDQVLLFISRLKIFSGKLKSCWSGSFTIAKVFPYGTVELSQANRPIFKVNGHRIKQYFGGDVPQLVVSDLQTFPLDQPYILGNVKTHAEGFCPPVFISSASLGNHSREDLLEDDIENLKRSERFRSEDVIEMKKNDDHT
nr:reverse transcriptase domain-containing protein [Tanacetum cinerariifolium]